MFEILFFIPAGIFLVLAIVFSLAVSNIENIPNIINVNIGRLCADDIRKLTNARRIYLQKQLIFHFVSAAVITLLISVLFIILWGAGNPWVVLSCNLLGAVIGLMIALSVLKKANILKEEL